MTFVIGQVIRDHVFLFCDSALTHRRNSVLTTRYSTFGQLQDLDDRKVEEAMLKVMRLPRDVVVGIAFDDLDEALGLVKQLRARLAIKRKSITDCVRSLCISRGAPKVEMLIGWHEQHGQLWLFDNQIGLTEDVGPGRSACIGSLPHSLLVPFSNIIARFGEVPIPRDMFMAGALVSLQAFSVFENLPQHGVGGTFFAVNVGSDGVLWQPDIAYAIASPMPHDANDPSSAIVSYIYSHVEDGDVWVSSTEPRFTRNFRVVHDETESSPTTTQDDLDELSTKVRFFGFYSTLHRKVVFVRNREGYVDGVADIVKSSDGGVRLQVNGGIFKALAEAPPDGTMLVDVVFHDDSGKRDIITLLMPLGTEKFVAARSAADVDTQKTE